MNNALNHGNPIVNLGSRTVTLGNGGPIVKVSSSTPVIQGPNGSVTLMIPSSSSITPSPNVSVTANPTGPSSGKRIGSRVNSNNKDRKTEALGNKDPLNGGKQDSKPKEVTLKADLKNIMHAFGDECFPSEESVNLMETILRQEIEAFLFICDTAAFISGSKMLGLREYIYAMRNDKTHLARLFKYLAFKDQQQLSVRMNQLSQQKSLPHTKGFVCEVRGILEELGIGGGLEKFLDSDSVIENPKTERALRADRINQRLTIPKYITYAKARSVSFARKLSQLNDWVATHLHSEHKLSQSFMDVLGFLIYEIVAQIVDLSCIIKRERTGSPNPIDRLCDTRGANPDTCMSAPAFQKKRKDEDCNSVSEILVQSSELEAKRLKKVTVPSMEVLVARSVHILSPSEIREAYLRLQRCHPPSVSHLSRAENIRKLNLQY